MQHLPEDARAELDREDLEAGDVLREIPLKSPEVPEDVLAEMDAEARALQEQPTTDARRADLDDEIARGI